MSDKEPGKMLLREEDVRAAITAMMPDPMQFEKDDNLLEYGLDSLRIMRLLSQWRKEGAKVTFSQLLEQPTLGNWLSLLHVTGNEEENTPPVVNVLQCENIPFELTDVQHAYWIGRRDDQPMGGVGCHLYLELDAMELDPDRLKKAWFVLLQSHPMLRVRFLEDGRQEIMSEGHPGSFVLNDLRAEETDRPAALLATRERLSHRRLAVEEGLVAGLEMSLLPHDRVRLHFDVDMLVADAQSIAIMLRDLGVAYMHGSIPTARPTWSFANWVARNAETRRATAESARFYWQERINSIPSAPMLPMVRKPEEVRHPHFCRRSRFVSLSQWKTLQAKATACGCTPILAVLTAYAETLARWSESPKFTLNLPVYGRDMTEEGMEDVVADFTNILLFAVDCSEKVPFLQRMQAIQENLYRDMSHTSYSGVRVLRDIARLRGGEISPGAVVFAGNLGSGLIMDSYGPLGRYAYAVSQTPQVWLDCQLYETENGFWIVWDAVEDLYPEDMLDSMFKAFNRGIDWLCNLKTNFNSVFDFMPLPVNRQQHDSLSDVPDTLHGPFFAMARQNPDKTALVLPGNITVSRWTLAEQALKVASCLKKDGLQIGEPVAVTFPRGKDQIAAVLGVLAAGGVYVPVRPQQPLARRERIYCKAGIHRVLTTSSLAQTLEWPEEMRLIDIAEADACAPCEPVEIVPAQSAYIIFTSGSTGEPKGVDIAHQAAAATIASITRRFALTEDDCVLAVSAMDFDLSVFDVFGLLGCGGRLVLLDEHDHRNALVWGELVDRHKVTIWNSVPILLDMLLTGVENEQLSLSSLRLALLSGDWIGMDLPGRLAQAAPSCLFEALGGATEASIWSNIQDVSLPMPAFWQSIPYGRPLPGQAYRVVDNRGFDCPDWVPGELWIGGMGVALGYRGDSELTSRSFVEFDGQRWYRTGDMGRYWPDGTLEFLGRRDFQVKIRGHRIELGEIEAAIRSFSGIRDTAVLVVRTAQVNRLCAFVTAVPGVTLDTQALRTHLQGRVPDYMVPGACVVLDAMPLSANGKLDRKALAALAVSDATENICRLPSSPMEQQIACLWKALLATEDIHCEDSFFELGGDSLLATRFVADLRKKLGIHLPLEELFLHPSLEEVAAYLERHAAEAGAIPERNLPQIVPQPDRKDMAFPLTDIQYAYWIGRTNAYELGNVSSHIFFEFDETKFEPDQLRRSWEQMVLRHDMLRAVFLPDGSQKIMPTPPLSGFAVEDLRGLSQDATDARVAAIRSRMSTQTLPAETGPLFDIRIVLYNRADGTPSARLFMDFDALIADAWSLFLLFDEWLTLYRGEPVASLPVLGITFRDYMLAENSVRNSELCRDDWEYWNSRLDSIPMPPDLPFARTPSSVHSMATRRRSLVLSKETWSSLKRYIGAAGLSPSGFLVAAYAEILAMWSRTSRFTLNLTLFNRLPLHQEVNNLVGDFTSLDLLVVEDRHAPFLDKAKTLQRQLWQDISHRLVDGIQVLRELHKRGRRNAPVVVFTGAVGLGPSRDASALDAFGRLVASVTQTPQVCLDHQAYEQSGQLVLNWDAVEELFPDGMIDAMFEAYTGLLLKLAQGEGWQSKDLPALPKAQAEERKAYNATESPLSELTLDRILVDSVRRYANQTCVITEDAEYSYAELDRRSGAVAAALRGRGTQPNQLVAVVLEKSWEQIVAVAGVIRAGSAYQPIEPSVPAERLHLLLKAGNVKIALTSKRLADNLSWDGTDVQVLTVEELDNGAVFDDSTANQPEDLAYVIYTSGSTGTPKGVVIDHRGVVNTLVDMNERFEVTSKDRFFGISGLHFDLSVYDIWGAILAGAAVVLPSPRALRDPSNWLPLATRHGVSIWNSVPALMHMLTEYAAGISAPLPETMRLVLLSGDRIPLSLPDAIRATVPHARVISLGGATEASIWSIFYPIGSVDPAWHTIPYGRPLRNQTFHVLDSSMRDRPDWVPGELYIGGVGLAKGYWKDPERTAQRFVRHPQTGETLYRTGDMGRFLPEGVIEFLGREDLQIKLRGYRIELGEIEAVLRSHDQVQEAVVLVSGTTDENRQLTAFVTATGSVSRSALIDYLRSKLPGYMVPSRLQILDRLPISNNGKIDRRALAERVPTLEKIKPTPLLGPSSQTELSVSRVWEEVLETSNPGLEDNFFDLGGTSVLAVRLHQRLMTALGTDVPLVSIFEYPTIRSFAAYVDWAAQQQSHTHMTTSAPSNRGKRRSMLAGTNDVRRNRAAAASRIRRQHNG